MGGGVTRVGSNRHLQCGPGFVELTLSGIQNSQVVIWLWQLRVIFGNLGESRNCVGGLASFSLDHAFDKPHLRVAWLARQVLISFGQCFCQLACTYQPVDVCVVVCMGNACRKRSCKKHYAQGVRKTT